MRELPMAPSRDDQNPSIVLEHPNHLTNLHFGTVASCLPWLFVLCSAEHMCLLTAVRRALNPKPATLVGLNEDPPMDQRRHKCWTYPILPSVAFAGGVRTRPQPWSG